MKDVFRREGRYTYGTAVMTEIGESTVSSLTAINLAMGCVSIALAAAIVRHMD